MHQPLIIDRNYDIRVKEISFVTPEYKKDEFKTQKWDNYLSYLASLYRNLINKKIEKEEKRVG